MLLTREQVKASRDIKTEKVPVPEWAPDDATPEQRAGCHVLIRVMGGAARQQWDEAGAAAVGAKKDWVPDSEALMARLVCCDEQLQPLFTDQDIQWLTSKSHIPLGRIWAAALKLNGMSKAEADRIEGNSGGAPSAATGSNSHANGDGQSPKPSRELTPASSPS